MSAHGIIVCRGAVLVGVGEEDSIGNARPEVASQLVTCGNIAGSEPSPKKKHQNTPKKYNILLSKH